MRFNLLIIGLLCCAGTFSQPGMYSYHVQLRLKADSNNCRFSLPPAAWISTSEPDKYVLKKKAPNRLLFSTKEYDLVLEKKTNDYYKDVSVSLLLDSTTLFITYKMLHYYDIHQKGARDISYFQLRVLKKGKAKTKPMDIRFGIDPADKIIHLALPFCAGLRKDIGISKTPQDEIAITCNQ
jgi:hypothetical protein